MQPLTYKCDGEKKKKKTREQLNQCSDDEL